MTTPDEGVLLDLAIEDERWVSARLEALARTGLNAALDHLGLVPGDCEVSLLGCDDSRISALNAGFRVKAQATNVLSWPATEPAPRPDGAPPKIALQAAPTGAPVFLGDIALAYETCAAEAAAAGKPLADHATHLIVHALLHLLGYDHVRDADATLMERTETEILGRLGLEDPYAL